MEEGVFIRMKSQQGIFIDIGWMIQSLDKEARRLGVTRQSIIKIWIAERLKSISV